MCSRSEASLGVFAFITFMWNSRCYVGWDLRGAQGSVNQPVDEVPQYLKGVNSKWYELPSYPVTKLFSGTGTQ